MVYTIPFFPPTIRGVDIYAGQQRRNKNHVRRIKNAMYICLKPDENLCMSRRAFAADKILHGGRVKIILLV